MAYPKASERYYNYQQKRFTEEWEQSLLNIDITDQDEEENIEVDGEELEDTNGEDVLIDEEAELIKKELEKRQREEYLKSNMEGMLKIEGINLNLPILKGATHKNLLMSLASIENTGKPGQIGNYSIAGHRNRTFGRNFNRLEEVKVGDVIEFDNGENKYKYTVSEKIYVKPEEVWVLNSNKEDKEITLVTCHPMVKPTHRLIIKGKIGL